LNLKKYIAENNYIICDGAMGTYYSEISGEGTTFSEKANINNPDIIKKIHSEYIEAGAKLIRTNTFSANTYALNKTKEEIKAIIESACEIAEESANSKDVFVGASIGPISTPKYVEHLENIEEEYKYIVDIFLDKDIDIFIFETFSSLESIKNVIEYIKSKNREAFILVQFAVMANGHTQKGKTVNDLINELENTPNIDAFGFNCATGPTHIYNNIKKLSIENKIVSVLPNAGFPEIINRKMVYNLSVDYFAEKMQDIKDLGVSILGGCCGTTPKYIKKLSEKLSLKNDKKKDKSERTNYKYKIDVNKVKKNTREIKIAVELDPPFGTNTDKIMNAAAILKERDVDFITISDSPIGKVRVSSTLMAAKIKHKYDIEVIPHICCRDRNIIGLKSDILGAYINGIRNILAVTGDPIPSAERNEVKSVFNLNSMGLMELITGLNDTKFHDDKIKISGALNLNVLNKDVEIKRMHKKIEKGAELFLTQPIFDQETIDYFIKLKKNTDTKIYAGIMPLVSYKNAMFLDNEIPGINIPKEYIDMFAEDMERDVAEQIGINIAVDIAYKLIDYVDGFYIITPFNRVNMITRIMDILGI